MKPLDDSIGENIPDVASSRAFCHCGNLIRLDQQSWHLQGQSERKFTDKTSCLDPAVLSGTI